MTHHEADHNAGPGGPGGQQADGGSADSRTWYEEFTVTGGQALDKVKELIAEGNVRRLYIKNSDGKVLLEVPLTAGVAVTAVTAVFAPVIVAVGAVAAVLTQVTIGVERQRPSLDSGEGDSGAAGDPGGTEG